jgi:membrane-associated phospholipid phosphatase
VLRQLSGLELLSLTFFVFFCGLAWLRPLEPTRRLKVTALGVLGIVLLIVPLALDRAGLMLQRAVPVALIPLAYWQTGLFSAPLHHRLQTALAGIDDKILQALKDSGLPQSQLLKFDFVFELAYLCVYPMVPSGLAVLYFAGAIDRANEFWSVVLPAAYVCYATLPFVRTLPPRILEKPDTPGTDRTGIRQFNLRVVRSITHESNTFPSGHAATAVAVALELMRWIPPVGIVYALLAVGIMVGAFVGRYHYAADVVVGAIIAVLSFVLVIFTQ